jgi:outer membrane protein
MNKQASFIFNIVLLIAVAILYYLHFSSSPATSSTTGSSDSTATEKPIVLAPKEIRASKIVYVNLDILTEKYEFIKDVSASAQKEKNILENQYQTRGEKLQQDYLEFQDKANKGLLSENQINAEQEKFAARKEELDQLQLKLQDLNEKIQERTLEANKNLTAYIKEYNKSGHYNYVLAYSEGPLSPVLLANDSLDITNDILEGINAQYKAKKK